MNPYSDIDTDIDIYGWWGEGKVVVFFPHIDCLLVILGGMMALENYQWMPKHMGDSLMRKGVSEWFQRISGIYLQRDKL